MAKVTNRVSTAKLIKRTAEKLGKPVSEVEPIYEHFLMK